LTHIRKISKYLSYPLKPVQEIEELLLAVCVLIRVKAPEETDAHTGVDVPLLCKYCPVVPVAVNAVTPLPL
jgi:hypothetical protein